MTPVHAVPPYRDQAAHYLDNALRFIQLGEAAKAGEFLWGSIAEAFKALAAEKGFLIRTHGDLWKYAREVSRELGDQSLYDAFAIASGLHQNFYESERSVEDIAASAAPIEVAVKKILGLLPAHAVS